MGRVKEHIRYLWMKQTQTSQQIVWVVQTVGVTALVQ